MGLTTALYTGLSGLNASSHAISVAGNNIANVNTMAFKSSRADFETMISDSLGGGSAPTGALGGSNPKQIGLGVGLGGITRNFGDGSLQPTGMNTDMAIEGAGFFIVSENGSLRYTRAGNFKLDRDNNLVTAGGARVQGYSVDSGFQVLSNGWTQNVNIPLGNMTLAQATRNVRFAGNLNAGGEVAAHGSIIASNAFFSDPAGTVPATQTDSLESLYRADGVKLFDVGQVLRLSGMSKGSQVLLDHTFEITSAANPNSTTSTSHSSGATLADLMNCLSNTLGIDTSVSGGSAGVSLVNGTIRIEGNAGTINELDLLGTHIVKESGSPGRPLDFTKSQVADGESVRTGFVGYDSLGSSVQIDLGLVLESKTDQGTTWRYYAQSDDDSRTGRAVGTGTLSFNTNGQYMAPTIAHSVTIERAGSAAATPQTITLKFSEGLGSLSALADTQSQIAAVGQDGTRFGVLEDFTVDEDGTIVGVFSNSQLRTLGQLCLATFANPEGLVESGSNYFGATAASGDPALGIAGANGSGRIVGGALELSNVDLSQEFINLITASTGFSANSRVLTTSDRLLQELLSTLR